MKMSFRNPKYVVSMIVSLFIVLIPHGISYAQDPAINPPLANRTQQVREAIVAAVSGVDNANDVTAEHLTEIFEFYLVNKGITGALKAGDFNGLSRLEYIDLRNNALTHFVDDTFAGLTSLKVLTLIDNQLTGLHKSIFDDLGEVEVLELDNNQLAPDALESRHFAALSEELETLTLTNNQLTALPDDVFGGLTALGQLYLNGNGLTTLKDSSGNVIYKDSTGLTELFLDNNQLSNLPDDVFDGLTRLEWLTLHENPFTRLPDGVFEGLTELRELTLPDGMRLPISLEKIAPNHVRMVARTGAPFDIEVPLMVTGGRLQGDPTSFTIPKGSVESDPIRVHRPTHSFDPVTVDIGTLPSPPSDHEGYALEKSGTFPLEVVSRLDLPSGHPLAGRTPQVVFAIAKGANIEPEAVTAENLEAIDLEEITSLNLASQEIIRLNSNDFEGLTELTVLFLYDNRLTHLPDEIFAGLSALEQLFLYDNRLTRLPDDVFAGLTSLLWIHLYNNQLESIPMDTFQGPTELRGIHLHNNRLTSLPDGVFEGLTELRTLRLHENPFDTLPDGVFEGLTSLNELRLPEGMLLPVSLEKVAEGEFKVVVPTGAPFEMQVNLIVENGSIEGDARRLTIPKGSVESNETRTVTQDAFRAVTVDFSFRRHPPSSHQGYALTKSGDVPLVVIGVDLPDGHTLKDRTPQVIYAILAAARELPALADVNREDLTREDLAGIEKLNLRDRSITALTRDDFDGLSGLGQLYLNNNKLSRLPDNVFDGLRSLTVLSLSHNQLTELPAGVFDDLTALTVLSLSHNQLTELPDTVLFPLRDLEILTLSHSQLSRLPDNVFYGLSKLGTLHLNDNQLRSLPDDVFQDLVARERGIINEVLTKLYLQNNKLTRLPNNLFEGLTSLEWLWVADDQRPLPFYISLEKIGHRNFQAVAPTGAPFDIVVPLIIAYGTIEENVTSLTIPAGSVESETITVARTPGATFAVTVEIGMETEEEVKDEFTGGDIHEAVIEILPKPPQWFHQGYKLTKGDVSRLVFTELGGTEPPIGGAPAFTEHPSTVVEETALLSNYPNPFNPETWIPYQLAEAGDVTVTIYDMRGVVIRQLGVGHQPMGLYRSRSRAVHWDGRNQFGEKVATGLYFYTLKAGDFTATRKMLIAK